MVANKRTLVFALSLATISLATLLVANALYRRRRKSQRIQVFLGPTRSTKGVDTTSTAYRQQLKEKSQRRQPTSWQGSKTNAEVTGTTANATVTSKDTPSSATIPSPLIPSSTSDSAVVISPQTSQEAEISVSDEASKAGESLKELIVTAVKEAKESAKGSAKRLKDQTINISTTVDSKDIRSLGGNVNASIQLFEEIMTEVRKQPYDKQIKLLDSYKDLLQTHINLVSARSIMARKLKPGA